MNFFFHKKVTLERNGIKLIIKFFSKNFENFFYFILKKYAFAPKKIDLTKVTLE